MSEAAARPSRPPAEKPPLRCFFGAQAFATVRPDYESRLANWEEWDWLAQEAHGE